MARDTLTIQFLLTIGCTSGGEDQTVATAAITATGIVFHEEFQPAETPMVNNATLLFGDYPTVADMAGQLPLLGIYGAWSAIPDPRGTDVGGFLETLPSKLLNSHTAVSVMDTSHAFDGSIVVPEAGEVNAAGADFGCGAHLDPSLNVPAPQLLVV